MIPLTTRPARAAARTGSLPAARRTSRSAEGSAEGSATDLAEGDSRGGCRRELYSAESARARRVTSGSPRRPARLTGRAGRSPGEGHVDHCGVDACGELDIQVGDIPAVRGGHREGDGLAV